MISQQTSTANPGPGALLKAAVDPFLDLLLPIRPQYRLGVEPILVAHVASVEHDDLHLGVVAAREIRSLPTVTGRGVAVDGVAKAIEAARRR